MESPIPATSVHPERFRNQLFETFRSEVPATFHATHNAGKGSELLLFATQKRIAFEEGDHPLEEIHSSTNNQHVGVVIRSSMVLTDRSATDPPPYQVEDLDPDDVLADSELRHKLPTAPRAGVPLDRHVKTTFSVYETRDVRVQSFLLIDRT